MEKIVWEDRYNIQVDEIDRQHQRLVDLMNRLIDVQGKETNDEEIARSGFKISDRAQEQGVG